MSDESRRKLIKSIAAGSGAIVAGKNLPESWTKPVVDSVMLPAHAQTSQLVEFTYQSTLVDNDTCDGATSGLPNVTNLDFDVSTATPNGLGTVDVTIHGDIDQQDEWYMISVEGVDLGPVGNAGFGTHTINTVFNNVDLSAAAADGTITVTATPNPTGGNTIDCDFEPPQSISVTLSFPAIGTP